MAKKKFYAVRNGRMPGIYLTWDECKDQVDGFPNARYKSFATEAEALSYMSAGQEPEASGNGAACLEPVRPYAFTDGSYNPVTGIAGWGGLLVLEDDTEIELSGVVTDPEWNAMRNIASEVCGAMDAVARARQLGLKTLHIYYDCAGVEMWPTGGWDATKRCTKFYATAMKSAAAAGLDIKYHKVRAHTGIPGNETADRLAKRAVGIGV